MTKVEFKQILSLAQSDHERELIRFTAFKSSGLSATSARKHFGLENMLERSNRVQRCIEDTQTICECIDDLSRIQEQAALKLLGLILEDKESSSTGEESSDDEVCISAGTNADSDIDIDMPCTDELYKILEQSQFNWFHFVEELTEGRTDHVHVELQLEKYYLALISSDKPQAEMKLIEQSHKAFTADLQTRQLTDRQADALNGVIVSDSESEDPDAYLGLSHLSSDRVRALIATKRQRIRNRGRYLKAKYIAQKKLLCRKTSCSRSVSTILKKFPNIGDVMEEFVEERNIGADSWRRTGVLTFDGNTRVKHMSVFVSTWCQFLRHIFHMAQ